MPFPSSYGPFRFTINDLTHFPHAHCIQLTFVNQIDPNNATYDVNVARRQNGADCTTVTLTQRGTVTVTLDASGNASIGNASFTQQIDGNTITGFSGSISSTGGHGQIVIPDLRHLTDTWDASGVQPAEDHPKHRSYHQS